MKSLKVWVSVFWRAFDVADNVITIVDDSVAVGICPPRTNVCELNESHVCGGSICAANTVSD